MQDQDIEIEARFINCDQSEIEKKLVALGAKKTADALLEEWIFLYPEWKSEHKRIRVRDDGKNVWLTYKAHPNATWEIDSTEEIEISASSSANLIKILEKIGVPRVRHQEKKRITYQLDDTVIDLDFWPSIPMVLEIEGPSKDKVMQTATSLGLRWDTAIFVDQRELHKQYYGIDLSATEEYVFKKTVS